MSLIRRSHFPVTPGEVGVTCDDVPSEPGDQVPDGQCGQGTWGPSSWSAGPRCAARAIMRSRAADPDPQSLSPPTHSLHGPRVKSVPLRSPKCTQHPCRSRGLFYTEQWRSQWHTGVSRQSLAKCREILTGTIPTRACSPCLTRPGGTVMAYVKVK